MGLNTGLVGKRYPATRYQVTAEAIGAYSAAIDEHAPAMAGSEPSVAPPMFAVVYTFENMLQGLFDPDLIQDADLGRMVHGSQQMRFHRPVEPGQSLEAITTVEAIEDKASGQLLGLRFDAIDGDGRAVAEVRSAFFFRAPPDPGRPARSVRLAPIPEGRRLERRIRVAADQAARYAAASGDRNPIHLDPIAAARMGFTGPILHGLCTLGLAQRELLAALAGGRPERMLGLEARFTQVVYPGDQLDLIAWPIEGQTESDRHAFVVRRPDGQEVLRGGGVELRPGSGA